MNIMGRIANSAKAMESDINGLKDIARSLERVGNLSLGHELDIMSNHLHSCVTAIKSAIADSENLSQKE